MERTEDIALVELSYGHTNSSSSNVSDCLSLGAGRSTLGWSHPRIERPVSLTSPLQHPAEVVGKPMSTVTVYKSSVDRGSAPNPYARQGRQSRAVPLPCNALSHWAPRLGTKPSSSSHDLAPDFHASTAWLKIRRAAHSELKTVQFPQHSNALIQRTHSSAPAISSFARLASHA